MQFQHFSTQQLAEAAAYAERVNMVAVLDSNTKVRGQPAVQLLARGAVAMFGALKMIRAHPHTMQGLLDKTQKRVSIHPAHRTVFKSVITGKPRVRALALCDQWDAIRDSQPPHRRRKPTVADLEANVRTFPHIGEPIDD